jgi:hypothetical protein
MTVLDKMRPESSQASTSATPPGLDPAAVRKVARADRRAKLFAVVRDAMQQCGFPAVGYRCKAVALDADGWRFLVLIDLAPTLAASEAQPEPVQALVVQAAYARAGMVVDGVYWRPGANLAEAAAPDQSEPAAPLED